MPQCVGYKHYECYSIVSKPGEYCDSCQFKIMKDDLEEQKNRVAKLEGAIKACKDCNDTGESYTSPTADSAQCLANLFSLVE